MCELSTQIIDSTLFDASGHQDTTEATKVLTIRRELATDIYVFFIESSNRNLVYRKSTNGGTTFGAQVLIKTGTGFNNDGVCIWHDSWTPGDAGSILHIADYIEGGGGQTRYFRLDTDTDTFVGNNDTQMYTANQGFGNDGQYHLIKTTNGELVFTNTTNTGAGPRAIRSTDDGGTWSSIANGGVGSITNGDSGIIPMPLADSGSNIGDVLGIHTDVTNSRLQFSVFNNTTDTWGSMVDIETSVTQISPPVCQSAATLDKTTGDVYYCYIDDSTFSGTDSSFVMRRFDNATRTWGSKVFISGNANTTNRIPTLHDYSCPAICRHQADGIMLAAAPIGQSVTLENPAMFLSSDNGQTWSDPMFMPGLGDREIRKVNLPIVANNVLEGWYLTFHHESNQDLVGFAELVPLEFYEGTVTRRANPPTTPAAVENAVVTVRESAPRASYGKNFGKNKAIQGRVLSDASGAYKIAVWPIWPNESGTIEYQASAYKQGSTNAGDLMDLSREETEN